MIPLYRGEAATRALQAVIDHQAESDPQIEARVRDIIAQVASEGDTALRRLAAQFGDSVPESFEVNDAEIAAAHNRVPEDVKALFSRAAENIRVFAEAVMRSVQPVNLDRGGFRVGVDWKPVQRVACYVPGGRYPLPSTALMTAVTAHAAGVPEVCIVSPSLRDEIIVAGRIAGATRFYRLGGAQAVAAMAFGTQSIPAAHLLVGPGNAYVTEAKRQLQGAIGIDMLAGPSEVAIIADAGADPRWVATDLLAQAEHDPDARAYLFTDSAELARNVSAELTRMAAGEPLPDWLKAGTNWGALFVFPNMTDCIEAANALAPEHLELQVAQPEMLKGNLLHYGALFMGYGTPVPFGDYMAGPNHTLPTGRTARFGGGLSPLTFLRPQTWIHAGAGSQSIANDSARFAELEGLAAHAMAARQRFTGHGITR